MIPLAALLLAVWTLLSAPARAAEMKIGYFDGTASVTILGPIVRGDFNRFKAAVGKVASDKGIVTHVYLYTPGGSVDEATRIGRRHGANLSPNLVMMSLLLVPGYPGSTPCTRCISWD